MVAQFTNGLCLMVCCSLALGACAGDECQRGEGKCENGVAQRCLDSETLFGSYRHWGSVQDCGAPELCVLTKAAQASQKPGSLFNAGVIAGAALPPCFFIL